MTDPLEIAQAVRLACVQAALDGYERAQIAGLCQAGAWECAVDAMRMIDLDALVAAGAPAPISGQPPP